MTTTQQDMDWEIVFHPEVDRIIGLATSSVANAMATVMHDADDLHQEAMLAVAQGTGKARARLASDDLGLLYKELREYLVKGFIRTDQSRASKHIPFNNGEYDR